MSTPGTSSPRWPSDRHEVLRAVRRLLRSLRHRLTTALRWVVHAWRSSLQVRVVSTTMLLGLLVVLGLGSYLYSSISDGLEQVWGYRHAGDTRLVNVHVQRLRSKIEHDPEHPEIVVTVRGVGYKAGPS